jgi:hypothetical protein
VVAPESVSEGVQVGVVVGLDRGDPIVETVSVQDGEDLGELGDAAGERVEVRTAFPGLSQFSLFVVAEVVRVDEDPAGQVAGLGRSGTVAGADPFASGYARPVAQVQQRLAFQLLSPGLR